MRKTIIALVACVLSLGAWAQNNKDSAATKDGTATIQIKTSAVCEMCKETIEKAMSYEKGVKQFNLDVDSKILTITYYTKRTSPDKIRAAVTKAGYDADERMADPKAYEHLDACCKKDYKH